MDKTRNKIFVGCLALLLVMVAGYALFSQNLTINGTAKAQGDFSVTATCQPGIPENLLDAAKYSIVEYYSKTWVDENGYYDDSCTVNGDTVSFNSSFKWPGARRYFTIKVTNTGSVTAIQPYENGQNGKFKLEEACMDKNNNDIYDSDECYTDSPSLQLAGMMLGSDIIKERPIAIENKDGTITTYIDMTNMTEEELYSKYYVFDENSENYELKLESGESAYFLVVLGLNSETGTNTNGKFMLKTKGSATLTYKQPTTK